ncbi:hypothetical protein F8144_20375 [Streptomyces triticiradicis]|uniref:Uncharacterized protein n=1 Tax=Streptomyces triticiradicis TaxID=2651189 RepID=A0A7J5DDU2_9ACTN|nr:hypothetical protein F8144_20375 [Streptomyces triticiradicis]
MLRGWRHVCPAGTFQPGREISAPPAFEERGLGRSPRGGKGRGGGGENLSGAGTGAPAVQAITSSYPCHGRLSHALRRRAQHALYSDGT